MDTHELAWAAGFFDGEGCTKKWWVRNNSGEYLYCNIEINQVDREVLDRFQAAVGVGHVRGPYEKYTNHNSRPQYKYSCNGYSQVKQVIEMLWPWLGSIKKDQAEEIFDEMEKYLANKVWKRGPYA